MHTRRCTRAKARASTPITLYMRARGDDGHASIAIAGLGAGRRKGGDRCPRAGGWAFVCPAVTMADAARIRLGHAQGAKLASDNASRTTAIPTTDILRRQAPGRAYVRNFDSAALFVGPNSQPPCSLPDFRRTSICALVRMHGPGRSRSLP